MSDTNTATLVLSVLGLAGLIENIVVWYSVVA